MTFQFLNRWQALTHCLYCSRLLARCSACGWKVLSTCFSLTMSLRDFQTPAKIVTFEIWAFLDKLWMHLKLQPGPKTQYLSIIMPDKWERIICDSFAMFKLRKKVRTLSPIWSVCILWKIINLRYCNVTPRKEHFDVTAKSKPDDKVQSFKLAST